MPNIQNHLTSLEPSKQLKELGVKQESFYYWSDHTMPETLWREDALEEVWTENTIGETYSAFLASELGEMLPAKIEGLGWLICTKTNSENWEIYYTNDEKSGSTNGFLTAKTEADARTKMLIYLLENNLVSISNINK